MEIIPTSDYWWRFFIYGGFFHLLAVTRLAKTARHVDLLRLFGYALAIIPVFLREGILAAVLMAVFLYGLSFSLKYVKDIFASW